MLFGNRLCAGTELTLKEAAFLSGATEKVIRHELAASIVHGKRSRRHHRFGPREVFFFCLVNELPFDLKREDRRDLFELIVSRKEQRGHWRREPHRFVLTGGIPVELPVDAILHRVLARVRLFLRGRRRVVSRPEILGGEPVFEGTRISVRNVGERIRKGEPTTDLLEDFPSLRAEDLEFARMFVELGRPPGRPRKLKFVRGEE
jgi:uncharacterized protein (DUF433 family)